MTGKPIQIIHRIIHGESGAYGPQKASTTRPNDTVDQGFEDKFLDTIKNATNRLKIDNAKCKTGLTDFLNTSALSPIGDALSMGASIASSTIASIPIVSSSTDMAGMVCEFVGTWSNNFEVFFDLVSRQVLILFRRIDQYLNKLEGTVLDLNNNIKGCIIATLADAKALVNTRIGATLDFGDLAELMEKCPCIEVILRKMFKMDCFTENEGNPGAIVDCLENIGFGPNQTLCYVNAFLDSMIQNVMATFASFNAFIKGAIDAILIPIRLLVKQYCLLLTTKIDMSRIITKKVKRDGYDCLLIYTEERKKTGGTYPGMNLLDIMKTFKMWANCFEGVCTTFSDDLKRKIKQHNEDLRLKYKHWNDPNIADIYISCIALQNEANNATFSSTVRELYSKTRDGNIKAIGSDIRDIFTDIFSLPDSFGKKCVQSTDADGNITVTEEDAIDGFETLDNPTVEAVTKADGVEEEDIFNDGTEVFKPEVEQLITNMILTMGSVINQDLYGNKDGKYMELMHWDYNFKKSQPHLDAINGVDEKYKQVSVSLTESDTRIKNQEDLPVILPTYVVTDDYSTLDTVSKPTRNKNESLKNYYTRWYNLQT